MSASDKLGTVTAGHPARRWMLVGAVAVLFVAGGALAWNRQHQSGMASGERRSPSVLVLPFRTGAGDIEPWSGLGLAQQLRAALDTVKGLTVRVDDDGTRGADYLVAGTIGRNGDRRDIGVELVRVRGRAVVWTGTYWRTASNLDSFTRDVVEALVSAIRLDAGKTGQRQ